MYRIIQLDRVSTESGAKLPLEQQHALVLHFPNNNSKTATNYVNEALKKGQMTVYVPVSSDINFNNNKSSSYISEIESEIVNYEEDVNRGNLLTLDIRAFYNSALIGDQQPSEELKILLEEAIKERIASGKNDEVTFVSGIAGTLAANQKFEESINAEKWWHETHSEWLQKGLKVTIICSHPSTIFDKKSEQQEAEEVMHYKRAMSTLHEVVLDTSST